MEQRVASLETVDALLRMHAATAVGKALCTSEPWVVRQPHWTWRGRQIDSATFPWPRDIDGVEAAEAWRGRADAVAAEYSGRGGPTLMMFPIFLGVITSATLTATVGLAQAEEGVAQQALLFGMAALASVAVVGFAMRAALGDLRVAFALAPVWQRRAEAYSLRAVELRAAEARVLTKSSALSLSWGRLRRWTLSL